jgi:hypothetical protein
MVRLRAIEPGVLIDPCQLTHALLVRVLHAMRVTLTSALSEGIERQ